jgi:16S rRNA processing protein RimM
VPAERFILIGRLAGAHGTQGGLKLTSYAESLDVFAAGRRILTMDGNGTETIHHISGVRPQGRAAVLFLAGITHRSQAEALAGCDLFIDKEELPAPAPGTYYWADLIGAEVVSVDGRHLGRLESILETGSNDVYVVKRAGKEILIPALKSVVKSVDLKAHRMEVDLPEGLDQE